MNEGLKLLFEIFPHKDEPSLKEALESSNGDIELASMMILSEENIEHVESDSEKQNKDLENLYDMFPNIKRSLITSMYEDNADGNDLIPELLNLDLLNRESIHDEVGCDNGKCGGDNQTQTNGIVNSNNKWSESSSDIKIIVDYTDVSDSKAKHYYYKNNHDIILSIIDIIDEYSEKRGTIDSNESSTIHMTSKSTNCIKRGTVQNNNGFAHFKGKEARNSQNLYEVLSSEKDNTSKTNTIDNDQNSNLEIQYKVFRSEIIKGNELSKVIDNKVLYRVYCFYNGNVERTLLLVTLLIDNHYTNITVPVEEYKKISGVGLEIERKFTLPTTNKIIKKKIESPQILESTQSHLTNSGFNSTTSFEEAKKMMKDMFLTSKLDFHGFQPNEAISTLDACLKVWWEKEESERELTATNKKYSKVLFLSPITVVTGRGIHSINGVSKVKLRVKKYLDENNYQYWEEPSYFRIEGKK
ncbi:hypothetical protein Kpol_1056p33 [Vanderwaltozyma polyspora DSM 70294]|uniref:CUE domain-containing protein n=1 Tax=Vanderwaltozyma polyspora (strain ATCC 22028 / DSM 70294 / BCRC 21397 / CBS 2163 / NBRC 10782 / NRRL Y-8283 / UCD 57-17) TaxID=436907 RepID=A7TLP0_VANPO|nr:uncharacterized protein Kpol_1056p33 [Vanderwaltozyma polyspora DSM 70294]EDO16832.1 hypothetical protein Kpol_1056p33 [Vanderwaltozyma polyspora DSM 70294]